MSTTIPPLFHGEILIPPIVSEPLVASTTAILKRYVVWDAGAGRFEARPNQPDLCLMPLRSGPIAAAGLLAFAEKHQLPIPACLAVDGLGSQVYLSYERTHAYYARLWAQQPEEFARLKAIDIERYGAEKSFLHWIEQVTRELDDYDDFNFSNVYFQDPNFATMDEYVGGYYRFVEAQTSEFAPPNATRATLVQVRTHPAVTTALAARGKAVLTMLDDVTSSGETCRVHAPTVLKRLADQGITYAARESMFFFPHYVRWVDEIENHSLGTIVLTDHEHGFVCQLLRGSYHNSRVSPVGAIRFKDVLFDSPAAVEAFAQLYEEDGDLLAKLQARVGIATREELVVQLLQMAPNLRAALAATVEEAAPSILAALREA